MIATRRSGGAARRRALAANTLAPGVRRLAALTLTVTALTVTTLTGCARSDQPPAGSVEPSDAATTEGPTAPVIPPAATANTTDGATAFTRYWFSALSYGVQTGDTTRLATTSDTECEACTKAIQLIRSNYSDGGSFQGGTYTLQNVNAFENFAGSVITIAVTYDRSPRTGVSPLGVSRGSLAGASFAECDVRVRWEANKGWRVRSIDAVDPII